ncbi:LpqB family beta-propeller domain-containing protein [Catellatospora methionotrophica]|uniref:LpqB family beta-propeller domain-containing protein n=1 Tax=Catellatospora methionotrophica TaxID=121620 RepID=UPI0033C9F628
MRRAASALLAGAAALALAGCGIGVRDDVVRDGPGPSAGPGLTSSSSVKPPPWRKDETDPAEVVKDFLQAAAGDHGTAHESIMAAAGQYIAADQQAEWNPGANVVLVDVGQMTVSGDTVEVDMRRLGVLTPDGQVLPYEGKEREPKPDEFRFAQLPGGGLVLTNPRQELLLNVDKLETYYQRLPIYFWNTDNTSLVPDLRYLPKAVPDEQVDNRLFDWLLKGPSAWLSGAVLGLPDGTRRLGSIVKDASQVTVNLGAIADAAVRDRLAAQLHWTLWPGDDRKLQLQLEGRDVATDYRFPDKNLAASLTSGRDPNRYAVVNGVLTRLARQGETHPPLQDALSSTINNDVVSAAVAKDETAFALVRATGNGKQQLYIGPRSDLRDKSTANDTVAKPTIHSTGLIATSISRPIWLDRAGTAALVLADRQLWAVPVHGTAAIPVDDSLATAHGKITGVSVAPDGRRMALVINGQLYVAPLLRASAKLNAFKVGKPRKVPSSLAGRLREVAFLREDMVVVSTVGDVAELAHVTIDGAIERTFPTGRKAVIKNLTAYVGNAGRTETSGDVLLDVDGRANEVFNGTLSPVRKEFLLIPSPLTPSPTPNPSSSPQPPVEPTVTAASFEG